VNHTDGKTVQPRIILRTHYQANEPRLIIAAVTNCSSPTESRDEDRVATLLERWARAAEYVISTPGAMYAVDNARHLSLLNSLNRWTADGLALAFIHRQLPSSFAETRPELSPLEERFYLPTYLQGAGGLQVKFAKWLLEHGPVSDEQLRKDSVLERLTVDTLDEYLTLATDVRDRTDIRHERDRLLKVDYRSSTKRHKRYPVLTTMRRLRLLQDGAEKGEASVIQPDSFGRLAALSRVLPDIATLERLIRNNALRGALDVAMHEYSRKDLPRNKSATAFLVEAYKFAVDKGLQACALSYLDNVLSSIFPATPSLPSPTAEQLLESVHRQRPGEVRFHVDRRGKRAFVLIGKSAVEQLESER
jgi:hypothetical protein